MSDWIRRFHRARPGLPRLVCFPHAGGSASFFFPVSTALLGQVEVLAVQYPGRQDRRAEAPFEDLVAMAGQIHHELVGDWVPRTMFFGHSMGAVVAYEVARQPGTMPERLVVSGRRAPSRHRDDRVHLRDEAGILAELKSLSGTDPTLLDDEEIKSMILPAVRADYRAIETYVHQPGTPLACPITAFIGDSDPYATVGEARDWGAHTMAGFDLQVFDGGHFYLSARPGEVISRLTALV